MFLGWYLGNNVKPWNLSVANNKNISVSEF